MFGGGGSRRPPDPPPPPASPPTYASQATFKPNTSVGRFGSFDSVLTGPLGAPSGPLTTKNKSLLGY